MAVSVVGMGGVNQQFFPTSDRPEVLVEVRVPEGTSIESTTAAVAKVEDWLQRQPETKVATQLRCGSGSSLQSTLPAVNPCQFAGCAR
ncbi:hypothetical protein AGR4A_pAt10379 [Agrobacterium tumefaciens str. B6]|uniref:Acriflavin resistance protein n=1 Tax=Agrobacterium tumefaciens str. B6 TaxID=1183423 RepID=A0A822VCU9_AGRTU|nr:hypothetical protein AGR4A_pAt10379 [Agrobacterium tumefaciens str. B6]